MQKLMVKITLVLFVCFISISAQDTLSQGIKCYTDIIDDWKDQDKVNSTIGYREAISKIAATLPETDRFLIQTRLTSLSGKAANSPEMEVLYIRTCSARRVMRMKSYLSKFQKVLFSEHPVLGSNFFYGSLFKSGGVAGKGLELLTMDGYYGSVTDLLPTGEARHPDISFDGNYAVFSWRGGNSNSADYHLYEMDLRTRKTRQITSGSGEFSVDLDPCYLPNGNIVFVSTRYAQEIDCSGKNWVTNLMLCNRDGKYMRQIGFDQSPSLYPRLLPNGSVIYSRWDYNDKVHTYSHALFVMKPDGTNQREYCNNNSWWPTNIQQERPIPGTSKIMAMIGGYHSVQWGKIGIIDVNEGIENGQGVTLVAPVRLPKDDNLDKWGDPKGGPYGWREVDAKFFPKAGAAPLDQWGQEPPLFAYPYPFDENAFLVSYRPASKEGSWNGRMGLYFMTVDAERELLFLDPAGSCMGAIPAMPRTIPPVLSSAVDYRDSMGTFQIMKINLGDGVPGIGDSVIKRLRVVELYFRSGPEEGGVNYPSHCGPGCINYGGASYHTQIATTNASWDAKWIVGEVPVESDGSVNFRAPARTALFFQALNGKGQVVQTMRSWATLQPGEVFSCVGCHDSKLNAQPVLPYVPIALKKAPVQLQPFYGPRREFNFDKEIQPVFTSKCISCHNGSAGSKGPDLRSGKAYDALTAHGTCDAFSKYVNWMPAEDSPLIQPPNRFGSGKSLLDSHLEKGHQGVKITEEDLRRIRCWIDIGVPRYGRYQDAFPGTESNLKYRDAWIAQEKKNIAEYLNDFPSAVADLPGKGNMITTTGKDATTINVLYSVTRKEALIINFNASSNSDNIKITLYNQKGVRVRTINTKPVFNGKSEIRLETKSLGCGHYILEVKSHDSKKEIPVIVLR
jgi:hypothetical protein